MRHVRMLGLSLVAILAVAAVGAVPALAKKTETAKEELNKYFDECPIGTVAPPGERFSTCEYGEAGQESFFQAGKVTVYFKKPIILRAGLIENEETGLLTTVGARYGHTISKEAEPAPSLTEGLDAEKLEEPEKLRYEKYLAKGGSTKVTATIELAGPASGIVLNIAGLLNEEPEGQFAPAFIFPVQIHLSNKFLGTHCYDGNQLEPIVVPFITGETHPSGPNEPIHGSKGMFKLSGEGSILSLLGAKLVNNTYAAPGVEGCGVEGGADAAVNAGLGLPSPSGSNTTELIGALRISGSEEDAEKIKF